MPRKSKGLSKIEYFDLLSGELNSFINKVIAAESLAANPIRCEDVFDDTDLYMNEFHLLQQVLNPGSSTTQQGNSLEVLVKSFFNRIDLVHSVNETNKSTSIGQIDIQVTP